MQVVRMQGCMMAVCKLHVANMRNLNSKSRVCKNQLNKMQVCSYFISMIHDKYLAKIIEKEYWKFSCQAHTTIMHNI